MAVNRKLVFKRFVQAFAGAFLLLFAVYVARGQSTGPAAADALLWSAISAVVFAAGVVRNIRKNSACPVCRE